jgi:hypothetical protein
MWRTHAKTFKSFFGQLANLHQSSDPQTDIAAHFILFGELP